MKSILFLCFVFLLFTLTSVAQEDDSILVARDAIGDLNASSIRKGDFPGSIQLPGNKISIGFGGFIRATSYFDSHKEQKGEIITPAFFNPTDKEGQFSMSSRLSRFLFDARGKTPNGNIRGYFEVDFLGGGFNIRHAYGSWTKGKHELLFGQFWSAFMDLGALAYIEGTGEPAISGAIFIRQAQARYTYKATDQLKIYLSFEDPSSNDVLAVTGFGKYTEVPDVVAGVSVWNNKLGHFQVGTILRRIRIDSADQYNSRGTAVGLSFGSHWNTSRQGKLVATGTYGSGIGRYLLGINGTAGYLDDERKINLTKTYGFRLPTNTSFHLFFALILGSGTPDWTTGTTAPFVLKTASIPMQTYSIKLPPSLRLV